MQLDMITMSAMDITVTTVLSLATVLMTERQASKVEPAGETGRAVINV
jgi:hypothetical protein